MCSRVKRTILCRSNTSEYRDDLEAVPLRVAEAFVIFGDSYWFCNESLSGVFDIHAPVKERVIKHSHLPHMNDIG